MKYLLILILGTSLVAIAHVSSENHSSISYVTITPDGDDLTLQMDNHDLFVFKQLQLIPIRANEDFISAHSSFGHFITLEDAMAQKKVIVSEWTDESQSENYDSSPVPYEEEDGYYDSSGNENGDGAGYTSSTVNSLYIENTSSDTLFVMAGELIQGGDQDRVLAQDMIIYPNSGRVDIGVYCVEPSRWYSSDGDAEFEGYGDVASVSVRKSAIQDKDQSAVWDKVAEITEANGVSSETGTYHALKNSDQFNLKQSDFLGFFENKFESTDDVVGVIFVNGSQIMGCEIFATPVLFKKEYKNIIHSYVTEVISNPAEGQIDKDAVVSYFEKIRTAYTSDTMESNMTKFEENDKVVHFTTF